jgi:catechol 2,3-dioxygenase-like lactoylglutathione lyase family enzyme
MERITHVRHIGLVTPKAEEEARFYAQEWGLQIVAQIEGVTYLRGNSNEPYLLAIYPGQHRGIHHIGLGLPDRKAVDQAAQELAQKGVTILEPPAHLDEPGGGYGFKVLDPENRCVVLSAEVTSARPADWKAPAIPHKISHIALNTANLEEVVNFYIEKLGFRLSDWGNDIQAFLRCNTDHHSLAIARAPFPSLNHVAYDVGSIDAVLRGGGHLKQKGVKVVWGPGRHGAGDNVFYYFQDAAGFMVEYTCEVEQILDEASYTPRVRDLFEEQWGITPPPNPEDVGIMLGEPDPGIYPLARQG